MRTLTRGSLLALAFAAPVTAAERTVSVTDFDRLRVDGSFTVEVVTGRATSARIIGTQAALDASSIAVQGRQLVVRRNRAAWGGYPGQVAAASVVRITVPALISVWVSGPAKVSVDRLKGMRVSASLEGSGEVTVGAIASDRLDVSTLGSGSMALAGTVANLNAIARGAGTLDASKLVAADAKLTSESAGAVTIAARRSAKVTMTGTGSVTVLGRPACNIANTGSGTVVCGSDQAQRR